MSLVKNSCSRDSSFRVLSQLSRFKLSHFLHNFLYPPEQGKNTMTIEDFCIPDSEDEDNGPQNGAGTMMGIRIGELNGIMGVQCVSI